MSGVYACVGRMNSQAGVKVYLALYSFDLCRGYVAPAKVILHCQTEAYNQTQACRLEEG